MNKLASRLDSYPDAWKPGPGDKLIGTIIELDERLTEYRDEPYPIVTVRTDDGDELAWHAFHTVAMRELAKLRPRIGETIGVGYHGKHPEKGYARYRIVLDREAKPAQLDWDRIGKQADADLFEELFVDEGETPEEPREDEDEARARLEALEAIAPDGDEQAA